MFDFGSHLKALRQSKGLTQKQLATETGTSERGIQNYEIGVRKPTYEILIALADFFDVTVDYLIGRSDDDTPVSFVSNFEEDFRSRLGDMLPSIDVADAEAACIDLRSYEKIAYEQSPLTFHTACLIADELGVSLDYLCGLSDDPQRH